MATDPHGFELDAAGNIKVCPLTGYTVAPVQGMFCIVKLDYALTDEDLMQGRMQSVQLTMTPVQLREVGEVLLRKADQLESSPLPTSPQ